MALQRLPPFVPSSTNGASIDVVSVYVLVCQEVLPASKALATGRAGQDGS